MKNNNHSILGAPWYSRWQSYVIACLILTNVVVYFWAKPDKVEDPGVVYRATYPLLDGNRRLAQPENLITNIQPLREYLKSLPEANQDWANISIYFEYLPTGANITVNPDLAIWPASLAKLPLAIVVMKRIEQGIWSYDTMIKMEPEDADTVRTPDIAKEIGRSYDVKFLLERLLIESDNTAYRMLLKNFTNKELNSLGEAIGLDQFFSDDGKVSAKDYSRLFRILYLAAYLDEVHSQFLLQLMQNSDYTRMIKAGLPGIVPYAHKWGTNIKVNVYADSGIVYIDNRPFMISVMIQGKSQHYKDDELKAESLMKEIGQKSFDYINSYGK